MTPDLEALFGEEATCFVPPCLTLPHTWMHPPKCPSTGSSCPPRPRGLGDRAHIPSPVLTAETLCCGDVAKGPAGYTPGHPTFLPFVPSLYQHGEWRLGRAVLGKAQGQVAPLTPLPSWPTVCLCGVPGDGLRGHVPSAAPEEWAARAPHPRHRRHVLPDRALPGHRGEQGQRPASRAPGEGAMGDTTNPSQSHAFLIC